MWTRRDGEWRQYPGTGKWVYLRWTDGDHLSRSSGVFDTPSEAEAAGRELYGDLFRGVAPYVKSVNELL